MNYLPNNKYTINRRGIKIFLFIASVNILFIGPFMIVLRNNITNAIYNFSQIETGASRERVIKHMSKIRGVTQDYSVRSSTEIRFYWPYTHRPPSSLIVSFDINGVSSISIVNADQVIAWTEVVGRLEKFKSHRILLCMDVIFVLLFSLTITLWLVILQYLLSGVSALKLLILSMACTLLTIFGYGLSRIAIIVDWL